MNKLVDDLSLHAEEYADDVTKNKTGNNWLFNYTEKLSELIVKECARICIEENVSNLDLAVMREAGKFTVQDLATKSCGDNLAKQIKKQFGVKE